MAGKKTGPAGSVQKAAAPNIRVRIHRTYTDENKSLRALASANIGDFAVHGLALFENEKGWSVAMPKYTYKSANGTPVVGDSFHPVTAEARKALGEAVVEAYRQALTQDQAAKLSATGQQQQPAQKM